jgi:hypothetical protein
MVSCEFYDLATNQLMDKYRLPCRPSLNEIISIDTKNYLVVRVNHNIEPNKKPNYIGFKFYLSIFLTEL